MLLRSYLLLVSFLCIKAFVHQLSALKLTKTNVKSLFSIPTRLEGEQRLSKLNPILANGWNLVNGRDAIEKKFQFADFVTAFGFMTQVAINAEKLNHHPEWFNVYNRVDITLSTHDCQGLSQNDVDMAIIVDNIAKSKK